MTRRIVALAWLNLQQLLRNPTEVVALVVLPLALTLVFGSTFSNVEGKPSRVPFVDEDGTSYSAQVRELLEDEPSFAVEPMEREAAEQLVVDGEVSAAVIVREGFAAAIEEENAEIQTLVDPASTSSFAVTAVVQGIAVRMSGDAAAANAVTAFPWSAEEFDEVYQSADALWEPVPPVSVEGETVVASEVRGESVQANGTTQSSAGFTVFFIMFATFGGAGAILEEREQGTLRRLLVTPSNRTTLITGKIVGIVITAVIQTLILTTAGAALFGVPWGEQWLANALILFSYILAVTGLAVLVSTLVRSRDQFSGLAPIFSTGLAMLGGCFWSLDIVGPAMQTIAKATPTGWAMTGLTDVLARNQGLQAAWLPSAVLFGFAAVTLGLGVRSLKWE